MSLRRFPWKVPRLSDNSYKLFAAEPTPGHDPKKLTLAGKSGSVAAKAEAEDEPNAETTEKAKEGNPKQEIEESSDKKDATDEKVKVTETDIKPETAEKAEKDDYAEKDEHDKDHKKEAGDKPTEAPKTEDKPAEKREVIRGPWRILRLLPRESRHVIGGMLAIDPKERIKMADLIKDPWVADTVICRQIEPSRIIRSNTHTHILEQPTPAMK